MTSGSTDRLAVTGERLLPEVPSPRIPIVLTGAMQLRAKGEAGEE